jgi:hypothetical protein
LTIGITTERFDNMTFVEVRDEIDAYNRRRKIAVKEQQQIQAAGDYQLAQLIGIMFNDPKKYPKNIKKAYPDLFDSVGGWRENKENWKKYAEEFNRLRGGGAT